MARPRFQRVCREALGNWRSARQRVLKSDVTRGAVHRLRIRMRYLVALEALLAPRGGGDPPVGEQLHDAFHAAGRLRDAQLGAHALRGLSRTVPDAARLARHEEQRVPHLVRRLQHELRAVRVGRVARTIHGWLEPSRGDPQRILTERAVRRLRAGLGWLATRPRDSDSGAHALHERRLRVKQLRYMAGLARAAGCRLPRPLSLARLAALQKALGAVTDLDVQLRTIARFADMHPDWRPAARVLRGQLQRRRATALHALSRRAHAT